MGEQQRLNERSNPALYVFRGLTADEKVELQDWFINLSTNSDPDAALEVPAFYKPAIAWAQMSSYGMVDVDSHDMKPWKLPVSQVDYWCDIWFANHVASLRVQQKHQAEQESKAGVIRARVPGSFFDKRSRSRDDD